MEQYFVKYYCANSVYESGILWHKKGLFQSKSVYNIGHVISNTISSSIIPLRLNIGFRPQFKKDYKSLVLHTQFNDAEIINEGIITQRQMKACF